MPDARLQTLVALVEAGGYTRAARQLSLSQPAVSHHIRQLEEEYGLTVFYRNSKPLKLTPEGAILLKYARRAQALHRSALQALADYRESMTRFVVGLTPSAGENIVPRVLAAYCGVHPDTSITIVTDTIQNIYDKLNSYEVDVGIVEGPPPASGLCALLLDTDYLCLIVSPQHPFASRPGVRFEELKGEKLILRTEQAGTRQLFDHYLFSHSETLKSFRVIMQIDSVATIKELVASGLGVSIIAHSACLEEEHSGALAVIPIEGFRMIREINMVHHPDFSHAEVLQEIRRLYALQK